MKKQLVLSMVILAIALFAAPALYAPVEPSFQPIAEVSRYQFHEPHGIYDYVTPTVSVAPEKAPAKVTRKAPAKVTVGQSSKWRSEVRRQLKDQHVWTQSRENTVVRIIARESTGSETARNGDCVGLLQFNSDWKYDYSEAWFAHRGLGTWHRDNRLSGKWSIRRIAVVYRDGGDRAVRRHWAATY